MSEKGMLNIRQQSRKKTKLFILIKQIGLELVFTKKLDLPSKIHYQSKRNVFSYLGGPGRQSMTKV